MQPRRAKIDYNRDIWSGDFVVGNAYMVAPKGGSIERAIKGLNFPLINTNRIADLTIKIDRAGRPIATFNEFANSGDVNDKEDKKLYNDTNIYQLITDFGVDIRNQVSQKIEEDDLWVSSPDDVLLEHLLVPVIVFDYPEIAK